MQLRVDGISVERESARVLHDISFTAEAGEWIAIVGANGAGKSTLLDVLTGMLVPTNGQVFCNGLPVSQAQIHASYLYQSPETGLFAATAAEEFAFNLQKTRVEVERSWPDFQRQHLEHLGLDRLRATDVPVRLSTGMQRKFAFALAMANDTPWLYVDEPTAGLDRDARKALLEALGRHVKNGGSVVATTHDLDDMLTFATRVIVLAHGRIRFDGCPRDLIQQPEILLENGVGLSPLLRVVSHLRETGLIKEASLSSADAIAEEICQTVLSGEVNPVDPMPSGSDCSANLHTATAAVSDTAPEAALGTCHPNLFVRWISISSMTVAIAFVHTWPASLSGTVATILMLALLGAKWRTTLRLSWVWLSFAILTSTIAGLQLGPPFHANWAFHTAACLRTIREIIPYWCFLQLGQLFVSDFSPIQFGSAIHRGLRALRLPDSWCQVSGWTAALVCRFIPAIEQMYRTQMRAYRARTLAWQKRRQTLRLEIWRTANILAPFFIRLLRVGDTTADAMTARNVFRTSFPPTCGVREKLRPTDVFLLGGVLVICIVITTFNSM
ncbi:energy-coupling factor transport system ATP-binding protein [Alicyclobacillus sacchari]|uniref:Energy-coupling factor transport system ATP-binding protein n=1 Tax=Alicyclobacillus sacchari TaxID=392010 RepID=A0A4R8LKY4_9BACL|nr:ATP-binding cassette domain-containing protein [Alicyclobacillus sacchari]TDY43042.1 energy-coupling factor transport system ATP-binding protein [Alicyclobacillus sacchari]GMA57765.1 hypothetical protein GCM10025858_22680 [Alicyclobacillus sacchari]